MTTLQGEEDNAFGRNEMIEWVLGIGMTLYAVQELGVRLESIRLFKIWSKSSRALVGRSFSNRGYSFIQSMPEAAGLREKIALLNLLKVKGKHKQWAGDNSEYVVEGLGLVSTSDGT